MKTGAISRDFIQPSVIRGITASCPKGPVRQRGPSWRRSCPLVWVLWYFTYSPPSPTSGATDPRFSVDISSHGATSQHQMSALYQWSRASEKKGNSSKLEEFDVCSTSALSGGGELTDWGGNHVGMNAAGVGSACMFQSDLDIKGPLRGVQSQS